MDTGKMYPRGRATTTRAHISKFHQQNKKANLVKKKIGVSSYFLNQSNYYKLPAIPTTKIGAFLLSPLFLSPLSRPLFLSSQPKWIP